MYTFVHIFQHLKLFSNNVNLRFDEDKLYVQGMDGSHVSVFELNITSSWFDEYTIEKDNVIGINSNILFKNPKHKIPKSNNMLENRRRYI